MADSEYDAYTADELRELEQLYRSRKGFKSSVSRVRKLLETIPRVARNVKLVLAHLDKLDVSLERFDEAQEKYHAKLKINVDKARSATYAQDVHVKATDVWKQCMAWLDTVQQGMRERGLIPTPVKGKKVGLSDWSKADFTVADVEGELNVSQDAVSSVSSSGSAIRLAAAQARADLEAAKAEKVLLQQQQEVEREQRQLKVKREEEELVLQQKKELLEIQSKIVGADARERVLAEVSGDAAMRRTGVRFDIDPPEHHSTPETPRRVSSIPKTEETPTAASDSAGTRRRIMRPDGTAAATGVGLSATVDGTVGEGRSRKFRLSDTFGVSGSVDREEVMLQMLGNSVVMQQTMVDHMALPKCGIPFFRGDALKYLAFIRVFEANVHRDTTDDVVRLSQLLHYCQADALHVIECCGNMESGAGYKRARQLLHQRFGDPYVVANAWLERIETLPPIHKAKDLQSFSDELQNCNESLKAMGYLSEIDNSRCILKLALKLPHDQWKGWCNKADSITLKLSRPAKFEEFLDYTVGQARIANHPIWGQMFMSDRSGGTGGSAPATDRRRSSSKSTTPRLTSFSTAAATSGASSGAGESVQRSRGGTAGKQSMVSTTGGGGATASLCPFCNGGHVLFSCGGWKSLDVKSRVQFVLDNKLCCLCLLKGHPTRECKKRVTCSVAGCNKRHATILHLPPKEQEANVNATRVSGGRSAESAGSGLSLSSGNPSEGSLGPLATTNKGVYSTLGSSVTRIGLPIVPIKVRGVSGEYLETYSMLDNGSNQTFCTTELAGKLELTGKTETMLLTTLERKAMPVQTTYVDFEVASVSGEHTSKLTHVATKECLNIRDDLLVKSSELQKWAHLRDIPLPEGLPGQVHVLIGQDHASLFFPEETRRGKFGEPYAVRSVFGWIIYGVLAGESRSVVSHFVSTEISLSQQVERFWALDNLGPDELVNSPNDLKVIQMWEKSLVFAGGHYQFDIPFKCRPPRLPDNRIMAERRLSMLGRRLHRDDALLSRYSLEITTLIQKGYAERVPESLLSREDGKVWYIPHHPVFNVKKPDKVRPVFDCAAKYRGMSLNDNMYQGPDLANSLVGVMLRFRQDRVAMMADVEAMFHQVWVTPDDRDVLRFLWWDGDVGDASRVAVYRMTAHLFGGVWSPSVANYAMQRTAMDNADEYDQTAVATVLRNFYVDDCLKSVSTEESAIRLADQLRLLLAVGGFKLTKWLSNSREVLRTIPESERAKGVKALNLDLDHLPMERSLGLLWDVEDDVYRYDTCVKVNPLTKRGLLSTMCSIYDPLGFVSPFVMVAKMIFQSICIQKIDWDDPLPAEAEEQWGRWLENLSYLKQFAIPRCVRPSQSVCVIQLHHFADASEKAYGAVTYVRMVCEDGSISCKLLVAKGRLSPLKKVSIPRLELTAAVLATTLDVMIRREMEFAIESSTYWSDSTIVLHYIANVDQRYQTFVANRLVKIREQTVSEQWRHVPTELNPADIVSRGCAADVLVASPTWIWGPEFLFRHESDWPRNLVVKREDLNFAPEEKSDTPAFRSSVEPVKGTVLEFAKCFSDWYTFRKSVAWLSRYFQFLKNRETVATGPLTVVELQRAEILIVKGVQRTCFENLNDVKRLDPTINADGIYCVGGRLDRAPLSERERHPWLLPGRGHITDMVVRYFHQLNGHAGVERCLADIRSKFWLIGGRAAIKRIVYNCIPCKKVKSSPTPSRMADLPEDRITASEAPFLNVGVDYFGPYFVKRGRASVKRYGCIFTCLVTRAVHIEISYTLDTNSFLNALQRFISRRGAPQIVRSDNGTNFVGGEKELRLALKEWNQEQIVDSLRRKGIQWHFNPPAASHMGGVWERQIRTVRAVLRGVISLQTLDDEGLATLMCIVEGIVNGRPLTKLSDDPSDDSPLTPNHLLLLRAGPSVPPGVFSKLDLHGRRWKQVQYLSDVFWRRWTREYLPLLQSRQKWLKASRNLQPGDLVLIMNELLPRNNWPLGLVLKTVPGKDGQVRVVQVRFNGSVYERPVSKIILLEAASSDIT